MARLVCDSTRGNTKLLPSDRKSRPRTPDRSVATGPLDRLVTLLTGGERGRIMIVRNVFKPCPWCHLGADVEKYR